jgi:hypothetical protein
MLQILGLQSVWLAPLGLTVLLRELKIARHAGQTVRANQARREGATEDAI